MKIIFDDKSVSVKELNSLLDNMEKAKNEVYPARNVFHQSLRTNDKERKSLNNSISITARNDEKKLVGFLKIITDHSYMFYILDVMVDPDYRNQGLGKMLIQEAVDFGKKNGFIKITLTSLPDKVDFYKKFGFEEGMSPVLSLRGEDYV